jgi:2',3'-cyclic-nucleotide 2'-phosphodiesterase (5'-nucleotidase family)
LEGLQKIGPTLIFDSGNALFAFEGPQEKSAQPRAKFILETMGKLGTKVMAAGTKDINFGATWLKQTAAKTGITILSANLLENGKRAFDGSTVIVVNGVRVGFIGLTQPGELVGLGTPMSALPVVPAVKEELAKLKGKADLIVLLAAVRQADAYQLSGAFKNDVDFIATSSESRGMIPAQKADGAWILNPGAKGQAIAQLAVKLDGKGPYVDLAEVAREKELLTSLEARLAEFEPRLKATKDPQARELMQQTVTDLKTRRAEQKKKVDAGVSPSARTFDYTFVVLNDQIVDDPPLKIEVLKHEPTYAGAH